MYNPVVLKKKKDEGLGHTGCEWRVVKIYDKLYFFTKFSTVPKETVVQKGLNQ